MVDTSKLKLLQNGVQTSCVFHCEHIFDFCLIFSCKKQTGVADEWSRAGFDLGELGKDRNYDYDLRNPFSK